MDEAQQKSDLEQAGKSQRDVHDVEETERPIREERANHPGAARPIWSVAQRQDDLDNVESGDRRARQADASRLFAKQGEDRKDNERQENACETQPRNGAQPPQLDAVPGVFTSPEGRHKTSQPCDAHAQACDAQEEERVFQAELLDIVSRVGMRSRTRGQLSTGRDASDTAPESRSTYTTAAARMFWFIRMKLAAPTRGRLAHDLLGVDRGRCVLRTPERPIGLDGDAPRSGPRVDQVERDVRTGIGEQSCALADDYGLREQVEMCDQVVGEQPSDEGTAAGHQQYAVLMRLQITDGPGDVAVQDSRARPLRVGEAGRCHVLGPAVQRGGDRARARIGHRSPGAGEDLVRPPAKEERGRAAVDLVEIVPGFGVEKWYGPSAALEAAAAILVRSAQPLHHAVHRDVGRGRQPHVVVTSLNNRRGPLLDPCYLLKTSTLRSV